MEPKDRRVYTTCFYLSLQAVQLVLIMAFILISCILHSIIIVLKGTEVYLDVPTGKL